jgi:hypothetical protein
VLVSGAGVPVGIPKESSPGETETEIPAGGSGTAKAGFVPNPAIKKTRAAIPQNKFFEQFIVLVSRRVRAWTVKIRPRLSTQ